MIGQFMQDDLQFAEDYKLTNDRRLLANVAFFRRTRASDVVFDWLVPVLGHPAIRLHPGDCGKCSWPRKAGKPV